MALSTARSSQLRATRSPASAAPERRERTNRAHHEAAERRADHAGDAYADAVQREGGLELLPGNEAR